MSMGTSSELWNRRRGALLLGAAILGVACTTLFATKIGAILASPGKYEGQEVTVAGTVTGTYNLLFVKYYKLQDDSGEIAVVTQNALPKEGEKLRVKGKVNQAFAIGGSRLIVIVERPLER